MSKFAVLGGGFIGRHLHQYLLEQGEAVTLITRNPSLAGSNTQVVRDYGETDFSFFSKLYFVTGNSNHTLGLTQPARALSLSLDPLFSVLKTFRGSLILLSSGAVFYGKTGLIREDENPSPTVPYGIEKRTVEAYAQAAFEQGLLESLSIVRLWYAFGPQEAPRRFFATLKRTLWCSSPEMTIRGDGESLLDPLHINQVIAVLKIVGDSRERGVFHLCSGQPRTIKDWTRWVSKKLNVNIKVHFEGQELQPVLFWSQPLRLQSLGWSPRGRDELLLHYLKKNG